VNTGDASYIKQLNRRILIEEIIKNRSLSRSDLARITGLNKATVSVQVNDLLKDNIIVEKSGGATNAPGRKPIILEMNGNAGYSVGIDIDEPTVNIIFNDLKGKPFEKKSIHVDSSDFDEVISQIIDQLSPMIERLNKQYIPYGNIGMGIGFHGIVNNNHDVMFTPKQQWVNVSIKEKLEEVFQTDVYIDNNANLCVFAEQVYYENISDLFCITLYSGIGLGIISANEIYRGFQGFAGEIGHMIIEPKGLTCSCGNEGCWELYASEKALTKNIIKMYPDVSLKEDMEKLLKDEESAKIINDYLNHLAIGLNNVINIFNPEKIVLNGSIINGNSPFIKRIKSKLISKFNNYREIKASLLGSDACALGGATLALKHFLGVQSINYVDYEYFKEKFN